MSMFQMITFYAVEFGFFLSLTKLLFWYIAMIRFRVAEKYQNFWETPLRIALIISFLWPVQYFSLIYSRKKYKLKWEKGLPIIAFGPIPNHIKVRINLALIHGSKTYEDEYGRQRKISFRSYLLKQIFIGIITAPFNGIIWVLGVVSLIIRFTYRFIIWPRENEVYS